MLFRSEDMDNINERSCIVCRMRAEKNELFRIGVVDNKLCFDLRNKLPGRGYYICSRRNCIDKAFESVLKRVTKLDPFDIAPDGKTFVTEILIPGLRKRCMECLSSGLQSGQLVMGSDAVEDAAKKNKLDCYLLARDASVATRHKYMMNAERKQIMCIVSQFRSKFYGMLFGKSDPVVMGWLPGNLCEIWKTCNGNIAFLTETYLKELTEAETFEEFKEVVDELADLEKPD